MSPAIDAHPDASPAEPDAAAPFVTAPHRPWPQLVAPGGAGVHVLRPMTLVTLVAANDDLAAELFAFSDAAIASAWWHAVGDEYGVGPAARSVHVNGPAIDHDLTPAEIAAYIDQARGGDGGAPAPDSTTLYLVYLPAPYQAKGASSSAYHGVYPPGATGLGDGYAVVSRADGETGESVLDELTERASHEIVEAATDTRDGWHLPRASATPWNDADDAIWRSAQPGTVENGDLCELSRLREPLAGGFLYQRSWSNAAAARGGDPCVPARVEPYFNVSVAKSWYTIAAGASLDIPFTGWSTSPAADWQVNAGVNHASGSLATLAPGKGITVHTSRGVGTAARCGPRQGSNNGVEGTLTLTAPPSARAGDFAVVWIRSFREDPSTCDPPPESDFTHFWPVGIHVE